MARISLPYKGVECYIKDNKNLIIKSENTFKVLSSAVLNGGVCFAKTILNHHVPKNFNNPHPETYLKNVIEKLNLLQPVVGFMTAANVSNVSVKTDKYKGQNYLTALVTAGLSNPVIAGDPVTTISGKNTINIIVLIDGSLGEECLVEAIKIVTEAKTIALRELDVRSIFSRKVASGTTTDAVAVACTGKGERIKYAGTATDLGRVLSLNVIEAVKEAVKREEGLTPERPLIKRLEELGITQNDLIEAAMELLLYHPDMGSKKEISEVLWEEFNKTISDVNVALLVLAGIRLEEDGKNGLIPGTTKETFNMDPVFLLADEILGMNIANYVAGTKGIFEFVRFDKAKPGILKKLGPFLDDVIGGLIAGVSSNMYTRLLASKKT